MQDAERPRAGRVRAFKIALVALSLLLSLLVVEVMFSVLDPQEPVFIREDPRFGFANIPNKSGYWQRETEVPVLVAINSQGLRDRERAYEKPPGVVRVMMLGDSMVAAFNVPFEEMASRRLEAMLQESLGYEAIDVINAGTQSWGTGQELLFWREEGHRYAPDVVVLNFYTGNDFSNNYAGSAAASKPSFYLEDGELRLRPPQISPWVPWVRDNLLARSALARRLRHSPVFQGFGATQAAARFGLVATDGQMLSSDDRAEKMLAVTQALVVQMAEEVRSQGGVFFVNFIPNAVDLWEFLPAELHPGGHSPPGEKERRMSISRRLAAFLEEQGIAVIDEWDRMVEDSRRGRMLFYQARGHWTGEGNLRAAEDVHRAILPAVRDLVQRRSGGSAAIRAGSPPAG